ncbi:hypothetical protein BO86DRAFT_399028 [Aspergillus japonicus CBS 114.51]|uniref:Uncharacterized protein n=1 Tax=Aspergillus japonicus CBS 114.51 TaxID=1448312 RepID=A0A8T8X2T9_ASPJA|nr:hypothetical protein BO86DRAFT_399028 [Aspergillus japonicus CBS 114.51]RAH82386.1 hypothetical protein BO86DRAFT_399028 [Aspergillus japonicus CBS 114.51]
MAEWVQNLQIPTTSFALINTLGLPPGIARGFACIINPAYIDSQIGTMRTIALDEIYMYHESINTLEALHGENLHPLRRDCLAEQTLKKLKKLNDTLGSDNKESKSLKVKVLHLQNLLQSFRYIFGNKQLQLSEEYLINPNLASEELEFGVRWQQSRNGGTAAQRDLESLESNNNVMPFSSTFFGRLWFFFRQDSISKALMRIHELNMDLSEKTQRRLQQGSVAKASRAWILHLRIWVDASTSIPLLL